MTSEERLSAALFVRLCTAEGLGAALRSRIASTFTSWQDAVAADDRDCQACGLTPRSIAALRAVGVDTTSPDETLAPYDAAGITIVHRYHPAYPPLLASLPDAPAGLFVRGDVTVLAAPPLLSVVGSRNHTDYGRRVAYGLSTAVARAGVTIVSGLALGIDAIAHQAALDADGRTIAVIGSSVEDGQIAPRTHLGLAHAIIRSGGAVLSEYPLGMAAAPYTFPQRNRIMAGLAHATLVVEAAERSGTLITARVAADYGRDVLAVPGSVFSRASQGAHALIRDGAKLVACAQDVLDELPAAVRGTDVATVAAADTNTLSDDERRIMTCVTEEACHVDKIIMLSKLETMTALTAVTMLELRGRIRDVGGRHFVRVVR